VEKQTFSPELIRAGEVRFGSQCGFCHGKDATGGESGTDLTRSDVVAKDVGGSTIGPVVHEGRPTQGMPAFKDLPKADLDAIIAFVHTQMDKFAELGGNRRQVDASDLLTGNAEAGRAYFNGAGKCSTCHSPTGDLAGIGKRQTGLALLQRLLYPGGGRGGGGNSQPKATFLLNTGQTVIAPVAAEDEFSVTVLDPMGARQTYQKSAIKVKIDDPLSTHFDLLGKYTDADMHNVYAYLESLK